MVSGIRYLPFWLHRLYLNGLGICPLAPFGCTYQITADDGEDWYRIKMTTHIFTHELSHRLQVEEKLRNFFTGHYKQYLGDGAKNCMLCSFQSVGPFCHEILLEHIAKDHTEEERSSVLEEVSRIIEGFLNSFGRHLPRGKRPSFSSLINECKAAGFEINSHYNFLFLE